MKSMGMSAPARLTFEITALEHGLVSDGVMPADAHGYRPERIGMNVSSAATRDPAKGGTRRA
jgi:hypothetical protein